MPQNPLTLTRHSLYDLVWSRPMSDLAKGFGISDVALAKRGRTVDVPIPYRGYWARIAAGQKPDEIPLPKYRTRTAVPATTTPPKPTRPILRDGPEPTVHFGLPTEPPKVDSTPPDAIAGLRDRLDALKLTSAHSLADTCSAVRRTAKHLKYPDRARLRFAAAERSGAIVQINVSKDALHRALLLADQLIRTAEAIGWPLTESPPPEQPTTHTHNEPATVEPPTAPSYVQLLVDGEPMSFLIEERYREEPRSPTTRELAREKREYSYHAPRRTSIGTGALRIVRIDTKHYWSPRRKSWYDHRKQLVETKIPAILVGFYERAQAIQAERAEEERRRRQWEEEERQRKDRQERRAAHARLIADLERQAGAWHRARFLRRYIHAARRTLGTKRVQVSFRDQSIDFLDWATAYVDQLDPLSVSPHNPDQGPEATDYPRMNEDAFRSLLLRVTGFDGRIARKLRNPEVHCDDQSDEEDDEEDLEDY
jgi:hypothetical protein